MGGKKRGPLDRALETGGKQGLGGEGGQEEPSKSEGSGQKDSPEASEAPSGVEPTPPEAGAVDDWGQAGQEPGEEAASKGASNVKEARGHGTDLNRGPKGGQGKKAGSSGGSGPKGAEKKGGAEGQGQPSPAPSSKDGPRTKESPGEGYGEGKGQVATQEGAGEARETSSVLRLDPETCQPWKYANRLEELSEDRIWSMAESIEASGQLEPGLVRPSTDGGDGYEVIFGVRRWAACRMIGLPFRAEIRDLDDETAFAVMWAENEDREDISPYSKGVSFVQAVEKGIYRSYLRLSSTLGISRRNLYRHLDLARLPEPVLEAAVPSRHDIPPHLGEAIQDALGRANDSAEDPAEEEKRQAIVVDILNSHPVPQLRISHFWRLFNNRKKKADGGFGDQPEGGAPKGTLVATAKGSGENLFSVVTDGGHIERVSLYKGGRQRLPAERAEEFASRLQALIEEFEEVQEGS